MYYVLKFSWDVDENDTALPCGYMGKYKIVEREDLYNPLLNQYYKIGEFETIEECDSFIDDYRKVVKWEIESLSLDGGETWFKPDKSLNDIPTCNIKVKGGTGNSMDMMFKGKGNLLLVRPPEGVE